MKKQRETKKENQRSETFKNGSLKRRELSLPGNSVSGDSSKSQLIQNAIKGPPGRSRSPGMNKNKIQPDTLSNKPYFKKQLIIMHLQQLNNKLIFKSFINLLLFKIMKKQLLVLAMVALGTSMTVSAQSVPGSAPRPISCTDDPLHPIAGRPYTYTASSTQTGNWTFWATKDPNFIVTDATSGVTTNNLGSRLLTTPVAPATTPDLIATSANYGTAAATDNVQITWSDAILSGTGTGPGQTPTFIAALKDGTCVNNFNAWQLLPINAFTVDILNLENTSKAPIGTGQAVYTATEGQCFDAVRSAKWVTDKIEYNFGKNVLYFEVVAANFTNSWTPTFTLTGLNAAQTAVIEWDYTNAFTAPKTVTSGTAGADKVVTTETNTANGVSIFVRVTVSNNTFEGLAATNISLAVDGQNSVGLWDVVNATCTATTAADQADLAMQTLDPRPNVTPVAPSAPFVPGNQTN